MLDQHSVLLLCIQGCLAAFFAKEDVTWACPTEAKAASSARSGGTQGRELRSCSPSMNVSTPGARENFKRRRCGAGQKKWTWHETIKHHTTGI